MEHLRRPVKLGLKVIEVQPYDTETELNVLEYLAVDDMDESDRDDDYYETLVLDFLERLTSYDVRSLSKIERILLVWKIREITIGDEVDVVYKCPGCGRVQQDSISAKDLCQYAESDKFISSEDFQSLSLNPADYADMDYDEFLNYQNNLSDYYNIYNNKIPLECKNCKHTGINNLLTYKNCMKFLSEDSFISLTEWLNVLVYYGHHIRSDVLKMTPMQRMLEIKYFKKIKDSENKQNGTNQTR